jgi:hypothetical protein
MELHVSLSAAVPNARWVEYIPQLDDVTTSRLVIDAGHALPPAGPGLGIDWDWAALEARAVARACVSATGRPEREHRSARHEGSPVSATGRREREHRSAQHEGGPASA